jgi:perosamine synthetase
MKKIIFPFGKPLLDKNENNSLKRVLKSNILVHGPEAQKFENSFKNFTKAKEAISVSSCTAGMHLVYFSLGIKKGDEVIVPAQTHISTAHAVELTGAKPVFIDCITKTGNIDISLIEKKINKRTKAIAIVHFLGIPVDINKIKKIAKKYNLFLLEDCALAIGAKYNNKHVGTIGDVGVFSFYPVKHFTTGEGGMIITNNRKLANKLKLTRAFGVNKSFSERKKGIYNCEHLGFNYRMSELHAAIGCEQLKKLPKFLKARKRNFELLSKNINKNINILTIQSDESYLRSSYYCLTIVFKNKLINKRDKIMKDINDLGIGTSIYYPHPVPRMNYYKKKYGYLSKNYPHAEIISDQSIAFPVGPHLGIKEILQISKIINKILIKYD